MFFLFKPYLASFSSIIAKASALALVVLVTPLEVITASAAANADGNSSFFEAAMAAADSNDGSVTTTPVSTTPTTTTASTEQDLRTQVLLQMLSSDVLVKTYTSELTSDTAKQQQIATAVTSLAQNQSFQNYLFRATANSNLSAEEKDFKQVGKIVGDATAGLVQEGFLRLTDQERQTILTSLIGSMQNWDQRTCAMVLGETLYKDATGSDTNQVLTDVADISDNEKVRMLFDAMSAEQLQSILNLSTKAVTLELDGTAPQSRADSSGQGLEAALLKILGSWVLTNPEEVAFAMQSFNIMGPSDATNLTAEQAIAQCKSTQTVLNRIATAQGSSGEYLRLYLFTKLSEL